MGSRMTSEEEILIRRYLLGEADDAEQTVVEERLMTDKPYFQKYLMLEESLTDDYVRGNLTGREREQFEQHFMLAPDRRESVSFARVLLRGVSETRPIGRGLTTGREGAAWYRAIGDPKRRWTAVAVASLCAILVLIAGFAFLLTETIRLRREVAQSHNALTISARNEEDLMSRLNEQVVQGQSLNERLTQLQTQLTRKEQEVVDLKQARYAEQLRRSSSMISFALLPASERGENQPYSVYLSNNEQLLRLNLELSGDEYQRYSAEVQTAGGKEIWAKRGLLPTSHSGQGPYRVRNQHPRQLSITLPGKLLLQDDYLVMLSGLTTRGKYERTSTYHFRVIRR